MHTQKITDPFDFERISEGCLNDLRGLSLIICIQLEDNSSKSKHFGSVCLSFDDENYAHTRK